MANQDALLRAVSRYVGPNVMIWMSNMENPRKVMYRCPVTWEAVPIGFEFTESSFRKVFLSDNAFSCPACFNNHVYGRSDAWLEPEEDQLQTQGRLMLTMDQATTILGIGRPDILESLNRYHLIGYPDRYQRFVRRDDISRIVNEKKIALSDEKASIMMGPNPFVAMSFDIPTPFAAQIESAAHRSGLDMGQALSAALQLFLRASDAIESGGKVTFEVPGKPERTFVIDRLLEGVAESEIGAVNGG